MRAQAEDDQKGLDFTSNKRAVRRCCTSIGKPESHSSRAAIAAAAGTGGRSFCTGRCCTPQKLTAFASRHACKRLPSPLQALGFTENDSAGQTNIFAVEPKSYVAGSSADKTGEGSQVRLLFPAFISPYCCL